MSLKKRLETFFQGWLPKKLSLPRNQRIKIVDYFMRLQLLRLSYGVMLGALLVTPFGVYHSISEPYIAGSLWGYYLPIGYVGLLLGVVVVLYPKLNTLRSLRFSLFMPFIGLSMLLSLFFSPNYYFINLLNGTNFSSGQIDVDFPVGNSAVLGLSFLSIAFGLVSFIRGWLPKESQAPSCQLKTNRKPPKIGTQVWIVTFVMGFVGGLLGAFGVSLGLFSGLDMYVWPILIGMVLSIVAAAIVIRKKRRTTKG
jgi:hypothetical protein